MWCGVAWCGVVWRGVVICGLIGLWCGGFVLVVVFCWVWCLVWPPAGRIILPGYSGQSAAGAEIHKSEAKAVN